jgi:hypothetical protein
VDVDTVSDNQQPTEKAVKRVRRTGMSILGWFWGLALDLFWLAAVIIVVSAAIWGAYSYGAQVGWEHPVLTQMAEFIGGVWSNVVKK